MVLSRQSYVKVLCISVLLVSPHANSEIKGQSIDSIGATFVQ
jgi:hypothetical protein